MKWGSLGVSQSTEAMRAICCFTAVLWVVSPSGCQPPQRVRPEAELRPVEPETLAATGSAFPDATSKSSNSTSSPAYSAEPTQPASSATAAFAEVFLSDRVLADTNPDNDGEVAPPEELAGCLEELGRLNAAFVSANITLSQRRGEVFTCGATQVVTYKGRPDSPRYNSAPRLTCRMALGLVRFEELAQTLAYEFFQSPIRRIDHGGTYSCRKMARFVSMVSEHSYANAVDVKSFQLASGKKISVEKHFGDITSEPLTKEAQFLRQLANRLYDDGIFSVVLTPFFDRLHHDHFHFDQARYRVDGTRG
jgi:hypothetical protein